jgi:hypothetical protein
MSWRISKHHWKITFKMLVMLFLTNKCGTTERPPMYYIPIVLDWNSNSLIRGISKHSISVISEITTSKREGVYFWLTVLEVLVYEQLAPLFCACGCTVHNGGIAWQRESNSTHARNKNEKKSASILPCRRLKPLTRSHVFKGSTTSQKQEVGDRAFNA